MMKRSLTWASIGIGLFLFLAVNPDAVAKPAKRNTFTFFMENDFFNRTDFYYTSGIKLTWTSMELAEYFDNTRIRVKDLPLFCCSPFVKQLKYQRRAVSVSIGQNMYTPQDIKTSEFIPDDRPYAGITYLSIGYHQITDAYKNSMELNLGMVGPHSYADESQKAMHLWIDSAIPEGWQHQIHDEPVAVVSMEHVRKLYSVNPGFGFGGDLIGSAGAGLGNAYTYLQLGLHFRLGYNIPHDFGIFIIRPVASGHMAVDQRDPRFGQKRTLGVYLFAGAGGEAVARDIFLDGNTFRDSHHVKKEPLVGGMAAGLGFILGRVKMTIAQVYRTKAFKKQEYNDHAFGSLSFSYAY